jgi:two-component system response regulator YesN
MTHGLDYQYRVLLAEDEPAAAENIYDILRLYCPRFVLVASAGNGDDALRLAREHAPDLLLTDIRMPRMDGLVLLERLHAEAPGIKTMIISGYQDFDYARLARRQGAIDYLLKPSTPAALQKTLARAAPVLDDMINRQRLALLRRLLAGDVPPKAALDRFFPAPAWTAALCRKNGLPGRFACVTHVTHNAGTLSDSYTADADSFELYGRDEMECLRVVADASLLGAENLAETAWLYREQPGYTTTVVCNDAVPMEQFPALLTALSATLDRSLVIGKTRIVLARRGAPGERSHNDTVMPRLAFQEPLRYFLAENKAGQIKTLFKDLLRQCETAEAPQVFVEKNVRLFLEQTGAGTGDEALDARIDDAFRRAADYEALTGSLVDILEQTLPASYKTISKVDTPEFFALITDYINAHVTEPLSIASLCKHFGISQTYLSRLFRKYAGQSFISYLTRARVEKAKRYLADKDTAAPGRPLIRDAAALSGFNDQFYFSRVFRSITGRSPSEWAGE